MEGTSRIMSEARPTLFIDLNSDLGESFGSWSMGNDDAVLDLVSSANIACGFHAGDPSVILKTVNAAHERGVRIGAHIGYRDLHGFGRRVMDYDPVDLMAETVYQIGAIQAAARMIGAHVDYVKPHGALYNRMAHDEVQAGAVIDAMLRLDPELSLMALSGTPVVEQARAAGLTVLQETFADRAYTAAGTLVSRREADAVHHDPDVAAAQALAFATGAPLTAITGEQIFVEADSICVHGDNPEALHLVRSIVTTLGEQGIGVGNGG